MMAVADLKALSLFSAKIGADFALVQGGGGNTSVKHDGVLWVKASGTWLAHAMDRDIFVPLPLAAVRSTLDEVDGEDRVARMQPEGGLRPSIETSLHALLPHSVIAHVHSVNTLAWAVREDAQVALASRLDGLHWAWVPYRRPGYPLTRAVADVLATADTAPDVLVLANHGLVVGGDDYESVEQRLQDVERRLRLPARAPTPADHAQLRAVNDLDWLIPDDPLLHAVSTDAMTLQAAQGGVLYPDHVVFLGTRPVMASLGAPLSRAVAESVDAGAAPPVYAIVPGAGVLLAPGISDGAKAMLGCLAQVGLRLQATRGLAYLAREEVAALTNWEAEAYRRSRGCLPSG